MCIDCSNIRIPPVLVYYHSNAELMLQKREAHRQEQRDYANAYRKNNMEHLCQRSIEWTKRNPEKKMKYNHDYYRKHKEIFALKQKAKRAYQKEVQALMNIYID
jgi:hypothetical protein